MTSVGRLTAVIVIIIGLAIAQFSINAEVNIMTGLSMHSGGLVLAAVGGMMLISKE